MLPYSLYSGGILLARRRLKRRARISKENIGAAKRLRYEKGLAGDSTVEEFEKKAAKESPPLKTLRDKIVKESPQLKEKSTVADTKVEKRVKSHIPYSEPKKIAGLHISQDYIFKRKLGEGGQGQVWLVAHRTLHGGNVIGQKPKAWKMIRKHEDISTIIRESTSVAHFDHENVVDADPLMFAFFQDLPKELQKSIMGASEDSNINWEEIYLPVMSMKYINGFKFGKKQANDLGGWVERLENWKTPYDRRTKSNLMPLHTLWFIISRALRGLEYINSRGKIHKDVKPANILINSKGVVKLTDFALTDLDVFCGSPAYMSPEQIKGKKLDKTTDVFSLGMVAYEGMTGGIPHYEMTPLKQIKNKAQALRAFYSNAKNGFPKTYRHINDIHHDFEIDEKGKKIPYGEWLKDSLCDLLEAMLEFRPSNRPTPAEAVATLEGIIYRGLKVPGPMNSSLAVQGLLYQYDSLNFGDFKPSYINTLLHLCRDPVKTQSQIKEGSLNRRYFPQIARPLIKKLMASENPKKTYESVRSMHKRTQTARDSFNE